MTGETTDASNSGISSLAVTGRHVVNQTFSCSFSPTHSPRLTDEQLRNIILSSTRDLHSSSNTLDENF